MPAQHVYTAINSVAKELAAIGISKDSKNQMQGYMFRGIDAVYGALAPLLAKHKLCILPRVISRAVSEHTSTKGATLFYVAVQVEFDLVSAEDGSKHTIATVGEAMDSGDKATNKAMSAAYKYAAFQAFCIPTEGDNDADATTHEVKPTPKAGLPEATLAEIRSLYKKLADTGRAQNVNAVLATLGIKGLTEIPNISPDMADKLISRLTDLCNAEEPKNA